MVKLTVKGYQMHFYMKIRLIIRMIDDMMDYSELEKLMAESKVREENDLGLACFQNCDGRPNRSGIFNKLPPLGKAALSYAPEEVEFANLLEKFDTNITSREFYDFAVGLFDSVLASKSIGIGCPQDLMFVIQERAIKKEEKHIRPQFSKTKSI